MTVDPAVIVGVIVAFIGIVGGLFAQLYLRIATVEKQLKQAQSYNRRMWLWARRHIDLYYRWRREGAPEPEVLPVEDDEAA